MTTHFSWQAAVLEPDNGLESTTRFVLLVIGTYMNSHGEGAWPSYARVSLSSGLNRSTVIRHIDAAVEAGWLKKTRRMRSGPDGAIECDTNTYAISFPDEGGGGAKQPPGVVAQNDHPSRAKQPGVVAQRDPNTPLINTPSTTPKDTAMSSSLSVFERARAAYPKRGGGQNWAGAERAWKARISAKEDPEVMLAGVIRYAAFCEATGRVGTEYVKQAATFFGRDRHYLEPWDPPARPAVAQAPVSESWRENRNRKLRERFGVGDTIDMEQS